MRELTSADGGNLDAGSRNLVQAFLRVSDSLRKVSPSITPLNGVLDVTVGFLSQVLRARSRALGKKTLWNWKVWQKMEALDLPIRGLTQIQIIALFGSLVALLKRNLLLRVVNGDYIIPENNATLKNY